MSLQFTPKATKKPPTPAERAELLSYLYKMKEELKGDFQKKYILLYITLFENESINLLHPTEEEIKNVINSVQLFKKE